MNEEQADKAYEMPGAIWTCKEPPTKLINLVETGQLKPCKIIDIGCGEGFYSIYLASKGFEVLGIDLSKKAIEYAKKNAQEKGVNVRFEVMDFEHLQDLDEKFDFVFEWSILHGVMPEEREKYVQNIQKILKKGGKYLSVCFNIEDPRLDQKGKKYRVAPSKPGSPMGAKVYFSTLEELKELFSKYFTIIEGKVINQPLKGQLFVLNSFFMEKK